MNVSGHRLSTIEIESALVSHPDVAEAGVVGVADPVTGHAIGAFVIPSDRGGTPSDDPAAWRRRSSELTEALRSHVAEVIGPVAKPRWVVAVPDLPKTRSGKIMRRLLVDIADGRPLGDVTSLQDDSVPGTIQTIFHTPE